MKKVILILCLLLVVGCEEKEVKIKKNLMADLTNKTVEEVVVYCRDNQINLETEEEYSDIKKGLIIKQSISANTELKGFENLTITISKGIDYSKLNIDESGNVPIMMYHGIHDKIDNEYTGGNVDKDGYQRTASAFRKDLEFYYTSGYRMIRLEDYVKGIIKTEKGYSPIIITFDDGLSNNIKVTGLDEFGNIIIDPNSAVGILEEFKKKYPDFNVTATFFVNGGLFSQYKYNEKILNWLVDNGYDIGNHSYSHADFSTITEEKSVQEIGSMYNLLDKYIPGKYIHIVALPFGSPYSRTHENFDEIMKGKYDGKYYETISALRVGWEAECSPFNTNFDSRFLKRIRAYDNNGVEFDIEMNFKILKNNRYISDGDENTIVIPKNKESKINNKYNLELVTY